MKGQTYMIPTTQPMSGTMMHCAAPSYLSFLARHVRLSCKSRAKWCAANGVHVCECVCVWPPSQVQEEGEAWDEPLEGGGISSQEVKPRTRRDASRRDGLASMGKLELGD